jgi:ADP-heptose:LPS heptosyltransferase
VACLLARRHWDLRKFIPSVDEFIPFDRAALAKNPLRIRSLIRRLRAMEFDLVFDAADDGSVSFNHLIVTALSGGRFRVGHARGDAAQFYEVPVPVPTAPRHAAQMHLDLLRAVTPFRSTPRPLLKPPKDDTGFADAFLSEVGANPSLPLVLIHPGGRGPKRWPASEFASVARLLRESAGVETAMVWGPSDEDAAHEVLAAARDAIHPAGILSFDHLISLIRRAAVFLSGDCGPMHVASALGTPVVAIFLVSDADKYRPLGPHDIHLDGRARAITPDNAASAVSRIIGHIQSTGLLRPDGMGLPPSRLPHAEGGR